MGLILILLPFCVHLSPYLQFKLQNRQFLRSEQKLNGKVAKRVFSGMPDTLGVSLISLMDLLWNQMPQSHGFRILYPVICHIRRKTSRLFWETFLQLMDKAWR